MVYTTANQTIPASGQMTLTGNTTRTPATWIMVQALDNNSAEIYIGGVNSAIKTSTLVSKANKVGIKLVAGAVMTLPQCAGQPFYDLSTVWVNGTQNDGFSVTYCIK